jgi:tetratricopeptide (TPR) repeat protein
VAGPAAPAQVVEVRADRAGGGVRVGSGLLVTGRLVLTAAHVVFPDGPTPAARVRLTVGVGEDGRTSVRGRVVWPTRWAGPRQTADAAPTDAAPTDAAPADAAPASAASGDAAPTDAALVEIVDGDWVPPRVDRLRWGVLTGRAGGVRCEAAGFPRVLRGEAGVRELNHLRGHVNPLGGSVTGRYDVNVDDPPPLAPVGGEEPLPWAGMSGAALFACAEPDGPAPVWLLAGLVVVDTPGFGEGRLSAVPARRLLADAEFTRLIRSGGGAVDWESVELAGLLAPPSAAAAPSTPAQLLRADAEVVALHGRAGMLEEFTGWCTGGADSAVRLLVGPGGQGKTRFARAVAARLRAAGWLAGAARLGGAGAAGRLVSSARPVLVVIDYAETRTGLVGALLAVLEGRASRVPVRLLLVARGPGDWWGELTRDHDLAEDGEVVELPPVEAAGPSRAELFTDALGAFATQLAGLESGVDWPGRARRVRVPDLTDAGYALVLAVHMAALVALLEDATAAPAGPSAAAPGRVADRLLRHEQKYWAAAARAGRVDRSAASLDLAVVAATLCGAASPAEAADTLARLPAFAGEGGADHDLRVRAVGWLAGLYPPPPEGAGRLWGGVSPDRLAEHFLARRLTAPAGDPGLAGRLLNGASEAQTHQALTVLARAAPAHPGLAGLLRDLVVADPAGRAAVAVRVAVEATDGAPLIDAVHAVAAQLDRPRLEAVIDAMPRYSLRLLDLAAAVHTLHAARVRDQAAQSPDALPDLAGSLNNLSVRLGELGRREEGLAAVEEAVAVRRRLAEARPEAFLPALAGSLNNLSVRLGELGRREEGLAAVEEAVAAYRRLAEARPEAFLPDLARSLNNLSLRLADLGRREEALAVDRERDAILGNADRRNDTPTGDTPGHARTTRARKPLAWRELLFARRRRR